MASGGISYGACKAQLATVVANGVTADDPRVIVRTNEAIQEILNEILPVNGCMTADVVASGTTLLLPKEMEQALFVEVLGGASVNGQTDVSFGWYSIVNNFTYVDPSMAHDLPLQDQFLQPDPNDASVLRRQYDFPGLTLNSTVRVTGAKKWLPIENDNTYLIVQNVPAIKEMIQSIEYAENNDPQNADAFRQRCLSRLQAEVKKHQLDPVNSLKRKAAYEADMVTYAQGTFGWTRARLAFELRGGLSMGKSELSRILEQAEMRLLDKGQWVGTLQEYEADVKGGIILAPRQAENIISVAFCGTPIDLKSIFFRYNKNGNFAYCPCAPELRDEGEITDSAGFQRKQYRLVSGGANVHTMRFVAKLRWIKKQPTDPMIIKNFEAIRLMCEAQIYMREEKYQQFNVCEQKAIELLDNELNEYLSGQAIVMPADFGWQERRHRFHGLL